MQGCAETKEAYDARVASEAAGFIQYCEATGHSPAEQDTLDLLRSGKLAGQSCLEVYKSFAWGKLIVMPNKGIKDITFLRTLAADKFINAALQGNQIADISPLARMTSLQEVRLGANQIADVTPLLGLPRLRYLELAGNRITSVDGLMKFNTNIRLEVRGNPVPPEQCPIDTASGWVNMLCFNVKAFDAEFSKSVANDNVPQADLDDITRAVFSHQPFFVFAEVPSDRHQISVLFADRVNAQWDQRVTHATAFGEPIRNATDKDKDDMDNVWLLQLDFRGELCKVNIMNHKQKILGTMSLRKTEKRWSVGSYSAHKNPRYYHW